MDRETLDSLNMETVIRLILSQAEAIERLRREIEALRADNAALRAKLDLPPKTPENSSTPPSQGHKAAGEESGLEQGPLTARPAAPGVRAPHPRLAAPGVSRSRRRGVGAGPRRHRSADAGRALHRLCRPR